MPAMISLDSGYFLMILSHTLSVSHNTESISRVPNFHHDATRNSLSIDKTLIDWTYSAWHHDENSGLLSKIIKKYPESRLIIAGMNPVHSILNLAKVKGIAVTGFVDDILPYYHESDFFIAPLRIARGVQNKVLQSFSCGLPVIATSMGAEGIDYTDGKNILIADTPDAFFDSIERLINNKILYQSLKENALKLIKNNYSWDIKLAPLKKILK